MLCIIAPEYESAEEDRRRLADGSTDTETENEDETAEEGDLPSVEVV